MSSLEPIVEFLRTFAKRAFSSYDRYQPELQFSKCMMKYARKRYPEVMRQFRMQNVGALGYNMYSAVAQFITNAMNGPQYDEMILERGRIGTKVEQMTRYREMHSRVRPQRRSASGRRRPQIMFKSGQLNRNSTQTMIMTSDAMTNRVRTTTDESTQSEHRTEDLMSEQMSTTESEEPRHSKRSLDMDPILYVGPRQFPSYPSYPSPPLPPLPPEEELNEDEEIRLADKPVEDIVEDVFDWEPIVLEGVGIDPKSIEKNTPMYCGKEYVFGFIKRFVHDFVLA